MKKNGVIARYEAIANITEPLSKSACPKEVASFLVMTREKTMDYGLSTMDSA
jgi:hypothetical protein